MTSRRRAVGTAAVGRKAAIPVGLPRSTSTDASTGDWRVAIDSSRAAAGLFDGVTVRWYVRAAPRPGDLPVTAAEPGEESPQTGKETAQNP